MKAAARQSIFGFARRKPRWPRRRWNSPAPPADARIAEFAALDTSIEIVSEHAPGCARLLSKQLACDCGGDAAEAQA